MVCVIYICICKLNKMTKVIMVQNENKKHVISLLILALPECSEDGAGAVLQDGACALCKCNRMLRLDRKRF